MANIVNDRDVLLQAAAIRIVPVPIPIDQVEGLTEQLTTINNNITTQGTEITSVLNNTKDLTIVASRTVFPSATGTITLTATLKNGLTGTVAWSVTAGVGTLTPSGNTCTISGSTVTGNSVTIRARVSSGGRDYDSFVTLTKLGVLSEQSVVNLTNQVTGQLSSNNVTGLGALALLNVVDLNTQTTGALNGQTQVTNLGTLAYANSIAANQIGAGTLAAGVIYAGTINAENINGGSFSGKTFTGGIIEGSTIRTASSGARYILSGAAMDGYDASNTLRVSIDLASGNALFKSGNAFSAVNGAHTTGTGVTGESTSGFGVVGNSESGVGVRGLSASSGTAVEGVSVSGFGGVFSGNATRANLKLPALTALPTNRDLGAVCFYNGNLCIANGTHWYTFGSMVQLT